MFNSLTKKIIAACLLASLIIGGGAAYYVKTSQPVAKAKVDIGEDKTEDSKVVEFSEEDVPTYEELLANKDKLPEDQREQLEADQLLIDDAEQGVINCDLSQDPENFKKRVAENVLSYIASLPSSKEEETVNTVEEAKVEIKPTVSQERVGISADDAEILSINKEAILYSVADCNYVELQLATSLELEDITFEASEGISVFPRGNVVGVSASPQAEDEIKELKVSAVNAGEEMELVCSINVIGYESEVKDTQGNNIYTDEDCKNIVTLANYTAEGTYYTTVEEQKVIYHGWQTIGGKKYYYDENGKKLTGTQMIDGEIFYFDSTGALTTENNSVRKGSLGIDVSHHQGTIDWNKVAAAGVKFAIIRCGYRGYGASGSLNEDVKFATNLAGAKAAGIITGSYFYSTALNTTEAVAEAQYAMTIVNRCGGCSLPVFIDMEDNKRGQTSLDSTTLTLIANYFCYTVTNSYQMTSGLYASKSWIENRMIANSFLPSMYIWVAQWNTTCTYTGKYSLWQFSDSGSVNGISGNVDLDLWYL